MLNSSWANETVSIHGVHFHLYYSSGDVGNLLGTLDSSRRGDGTPGQCTTSGNIGLPTVMKGFKMKLVDNNRQVEPIPCTTPHHTTMY